MTPEPRVIVTKPYLGLLHMQVCVVADATDEEILEVCNRDNRCGTEFGWVTVLRGSTAELAQQAPIACQSNPSRVHLLVRC